MPIINGPIPDPEEPERDEPEAKAELRASYTRAKQIRDFRRIFHRDPASDGELDGFVEEYLTESYNSGRSQFD